MDDKTLCSIYQQKKYKQTIESDCALVTFPGFREITQEGFITWFANSAFEQGCYYCGITNAESRKLYDLQRNGSRPDSTRGGKRGKRLELDRRNPRESYDNLANLVWCCYWCNNAKTNFFSEEEFKPIGKRIGEQLRQILAAHA